MRLPLACPWGCTRERDHLNGEKMTEHDESQPMKIVALIEDIFERRGADSYLGEDVTMSQHMLQAAQLAEEANASDEIVVAALLHDIGHYTNEFPEDAMEQGVNNFHDEAGAAIMQSHFPDTVINCIRYHVDAKRYLCATDPAYYDDLSDASKQSLAVQGGPMSATEVADFEKMPDVNDIVQVRRWDDLAKDTERTTPPFAYYKPRLERVVLQRS